MSITCLDFPDTETATFWIGTEEGSVYQANRYDRASAKAGLSSAPEDIYRGHAGPVTGIQFHPSSGSIDFSDLFLTSSVDWTVKLWRTKGTQAKTAEKSTAVALGRKLTPADLAGTHKTLAGTEITVAGSGEKFTVGKDKANVICGNVQTANATVYIIDGVLLP